MIVHLNGNLISREHARIDPFDRGFVFGEGVYEGLRAIAWENSSRIVGLSRHIARMRKGVEAAHIDFDPTRLGEMSAELVKANNLRDAFVYWQATGGTPGEGDPVRSRVRGRHTKPTIFGYCTPQPPLSAQTAPATKKAVTRQDIRWEMGWLKSISLMGNVMLAAQADAAGCDEGILIRKGLVSEGLATNILAAIPSTAHGTRLITPDLKTVPILNGVTRQILLLMDPDIHEGSIHETDLATAREVMFLGTTTLVTSIVQIDGRRVGDGTPGPEARRLLKMLVDAYLAGKDIE